MYFNGANCDIYIGKGAGKKLLKDMREAKESIKIVSPYLSPFLISELISFKERNIDIELITTDNIEDFYGNYEKNIHKLIRQHRKTDYEAVEKRNKWINIKKILTYCTIGLFTIFISLIYITKDIQTLFGLIPFVILILIIRLYSKKIRNMRIYSYSYSKFFPFKVYMSPDTTKLSDTFIHSKIYLIDDKIAYLGSLNFTASGTKYNYETRIRTEDKNAINEIKREINQLMYYSNIPERDIQFWGSQLYKEPIN